MADGVGIPESNNRCGVNRQRYLPLSGSESTACRESEDVNVGDPTSPHRDRVLTDKYKSEGVEMASRKSEQA